MDFSLNKSQIICMDPLTSFTYFHDQIDNTKYSKEVIKFKITLNEKDQDNTIELIKHSNED